MKAHLVGTGLASSPGYRGKKLGDLGKPLASVLTAAHLGLPAPAANWRPRLALAAAHLMTYGDTLVRDAVLV